MVALLATLFAVPASVGLFLLFTAPLQQGCGYIIRRAVMGALFSLLSALILFLSLLLLS